MKNFKYFIFLIALLSTIFIFSCNKSEEEFEGILMNHSELSFNFSGDENNIYLKTSIKDDEFPDGVKYYYLYPEQNYYQDFKNNVGKTVIVEGKLQGKVKYIPPMINIHGDDILDKDEENSKPDIYEMEYIYPAKIKKVIS